MTGDAESQVSRTATWGRSPAPSPPIGSPAGCRRVTRWISPGTRRSVAAASIPAVAMRTASCWHLDACPAGLSRQEDGREMAGVLEDPLRAGVPRARSLPAPRGSCTAHVADIPSSTVSERAPRACVNAWGSGGRSPRSAPGRRPLQPREELVLTADAIRVDPARATRLPSGGYRRCLWRVGRFTCWPEPGSATCRRCSSGSSPSVTSPRIRPLGGPPPSTSASRPRSRSRRRPRRWAWTSSRPASTTTRRSCRPRPRRCSATSPPRPSGSSCRRRRR